MDTLEIVGSVPRAPSAGSCRDIPFSGSRTDRKSSTNVVSGWSTSTAPDSPSRLINLFTSRTHLQVGGLRWRTWWHRLASHCLEKETRSCDGGSYFYPWSRTSTSARMWTRSFKDSRRVFLGKVSSRELRSAIMNSTRSRSAATAMAG